LLENWEIPKRSCVKKLIITRRKLNNQHIKVLNHQHNLIISKLITSII